jgi:hypothetical protein
MLFFGTLRGGVNPSLEEIMANTRSTDAKRAWRPLISVVQEIKVIVFSSFARRVSG